jgi:hypothetical protein
MLALEPIVRLSRDIVKGMSTMTEQEARFLVDSYYQMQEFRKRTANQDRAMADEPHDSLMWFLSQTDTMEKQIERALDNYTANVSDVGRWLRSVKGIGPVLAANFLANLDVTRSETAGGFWRFAGLDPTVRWEKKTKRPWNASLKTACWKASDSWVKLKGHEDSFYSHIYVRRKEYEVARNERGELADQAAAGMARVGKDTEAYKHYAEGRLPPGHIDMRARRYTSKMFLAHLHEVMFEDHYGRKPPLPYVIEHGGHAHIIGPPGWPL